MKTMIHFVCLMILGLPMLAVAADERPVINWTAKDVAGADVKVPVDRVSVVAFIRPDQEQSKQAMKQIQTVLSDANSAQIVIILSGPTASDNAKQIVTEQSKSWIVVPAPEFAASGKMGIHVWPTTLVVKSDGTQVAHLAGMPKSFTTDLRAYLDYATGKLDDSGLQKRMTTQEVVTDS